MRNYLYTIILLNYSDFFIARRIKNIINVPIFDFSKSVSHFPQRSLFSRPSPVNFFFLISYTKRTSFLSLLQSHATTKITFVSPVTLSFAKKEMGMSEWAIKAVLQMQTFIKKILSLIAYVVATAVMSGLWPCYRLQRHTTASFLCCDVGGSRQNTCRWQFFFLFTKLYI